MACTLTNLEGVCFAFFTERVKCDECNGHRTRATADAGNEQVTAPVLQNAPSWFTGNLDTLTIVALPRQVTQVLETCLESLVRRLPGC